jgi:hypothetical protein
MNEFIKLVPLARDSVLGQPSTKQNTTLLFPMMFYSGPSISTPFTPYLTRGLSPFNVLIYAKSGVKAAYIPYSGVCQAPKKYVYNTFFETV